MFVEPLRCRLGRPADLDDVRAIECAAWSTGAASREMLEHRLCTPGFETVIIEDGRGVPVAFAQVVWTTLEQLSTCSGWRSLAFGTPCPDGEIAFGINASARPSRLASGGGTAALEAAMTLVHRSRRRAFVACGRLPAYARWSTRYDVRTYCRLVRYEGRVYSADPAEVVECPRDPSAPSQLVPAALAATVRDEGRHVDPFVRMIHRVTVAGEGNRMIGVVPNYFDDPASGNWGLLYAWFNPEVVADPVAEEARLAESLEPGMGLRRLADPMVL